LIGKEDTSSEADEEELKFTLGDNDEVLDPGAAMLVLQAFYPFSVW
jgi:hypothetical protein